MHLNNLNAPVLNVLNWRSLKAIYKFVRGVNKLLSAVCSNVDRCGRISVLGAARDAVQTLRADVVAVGGGKAGRNYIYTFVVVKVKNAAVKCVDCVCGSPVDMLT